MFIYARFTYVCPVNPAQPMPFVSASIYHKAIRLAFQEGLSPDLLAHHRERQEIRKGAPYLPMDLLLEAYELADQHLAAGFGVRQGIQLHSDDYGTLGLSWKTCWRARDVLERIERYMILVTDQGEARLEPHPQTTRMYLLRDASRRGVEMANETTFVMLSGIIREVTGTAIQPVRVEFKHRSLQPAPFRDHFPCPVYFGQAENVIEFHTHDLDVPTIKADKHLQRFLLTHLEEEKKGIHAQADQLLGEIHQLIEEALPSGIPSLSQVADYLHMSSRTLRRRLATKQLSFRELVQGIQHELAVDLLRHSEQSIGEIAFRTGFSEQSAFHRAFKRWTGHSPADYRKQA